MPPGLLFCLPAACYTVLACRFWFITDDAFISFRYARNWAEGLGLRYNIGVDPPVEGFSNFLWTALMAGLHWLGLDMAAAATWVSFFLGLLLLWIVNRYLLALFGPGRGAVFLGTLFLALLPPFAVWSTGGLETMLFAFLLFIAFANLPGSSGKPRPLLAGTAAGLLALTRPEGIIWGLALAGIHLLRRLLERKKVVDGNLFRYLAPLLAITAIFLAARILYFEKPLPNTAYAKVGFSAEIVERGALYFANFCLTFVTPAILIVSMPFLWIGRKGQGPVAAAAAVIGGFAAFTILTGGDFMAMGRFLAPAAPFLAITCAAVFLAMRPGDLVPTKPIWILAVLCLAVQVLPAFDLGLLPRSLQKALHFRWNVDEIRTEAEQWAYMKENTRRWAAAGKALNNYASEGDSVVCPNIGAIGYHSGLFIFDMCGLIDPTVSQWEALPGKAKKSAGHERMRPMGYFLVHGPTVLMLIVVETDEDYRKFVSLCREQGLPPGYGLRALPLDSVDDAPEDTTMMLIVRRQSPLFKKLPPAARRSSGSHFKQGPVENRR